uniref:Putative trypsin-like serine protease n=1 Tax=Corethrella appendiculata TaxID=1370023 RepID=U5ERX9_9DIPT
MSNFKLFLICALIGVAVAGYTNRIVGGQFAEENQFPFQVALLRRGRLFCNGAIVHRRFVLTAAHCLFAGDEMFEAENIKVLYGTNKITSGGKYNRVEKIYVHEDFEGYQNDIALIEMKKDFVFGESADYIRIRNETVEEGTEVSVTAWGRTNFQLQYNKMTTESESDCSENLADDFNANLLCLNGKVNTGVCFGDDGAPAFYNFELVGIASYIKGPVCGTEKPDVFTNTANFYEWITEKFD